MDNMTDFSSLEALETEIFLAAEPEKRSGAPEPSQSQSQSQPEPKNKGEQDAKPKVPRKQKLIEDIEALYAKMGDAPPMSTSALGKQKIADLQQILAEAVEKSTLRLAQQKVAIKQETEIDEGRIERSAAALYQLNKTLCVMLERGSMALVDKTGVSLEGLTADFEAERETMESLLMSIYADNSAMLDEYLSPSIQWSLMMMRITLGRAAMNLKKQSQTSEAV